MKRYVYINGRVVEEAKAHVSVFDRGLNYGDGLFETMKSTQGQIPLLKVHMARLLAGAKLLKIPKSGLKRLISDIRAGVLTRLLKKNGLGAGTAGVRITVTRGVDAGGYLPKRGLSPTIIITARAIDEGRIAGIRKNGVKGVLLRGAIPPLAGVKTVNFLPNVLGRAEAKRRGASEGIFVEPGGYVTEGTASNIFIVKKGVIRTPPLSRNALSTGVLPGITRAGAIKSARAERIPLKEVRVSAAELLGSDEAFLTSSIMGVVALIEVDGKAIGPDGKMGPVTSLIQTTL
jgi:branched-chain amino acid aminotransferase